MNKTRVMVTGAGGASGLGTIKSLLRIDEVEIIGVDLNPLAVGLYISHKKALLPRANSKEFISKLIEVLKREKVDVLIPNTSEEMYPIAKNIEEIKRHTSIIVSEPESIKIADDKLRAHDHLTRKNIPVVRTISVKDEVDIAKAIGELSLPIAIKPRISRGGRGLFICSDLEEVSRSFKMLREMMPFSDTFFGSEESDQIICQEHLPGTEYDVNILLNEDSEVVANVPMKAWRWDVHHQLRDIVTEHNKEVQSLAEKATKSLNLKGPIDVEMRFDKDEGLKILEINSRTGGDVELASAAGCNIPHLTSKLSLGEDLKYIDFNDDVVLTRFIGFQTIKRSEIPDEI
ncbi:MAG: ATP-grasp domain-containing protein [Halobacteriota archaeon]|nr:ATP-grasp domain-containing protein [Halobacteriota archaeon]